MATKRESRAAPATIAGLNKLEAAQEKAKNAYYKLVDKTDNYRSRVKKLGSGYTEDIDGTTYAISITPWDKYSYPKMIIFPLKS